jgi:3-oxoacyl-[acyl-carrier protein] reductase
MVERRVAMVIGGGRNIGRQIVTTLADQGHDVAIVVREHADQADRVADEVRAGGHRATAHQADIARSADIDSVVEKTIAEFGRIDVLVNCASVRPHTSLLDLTDEVWQRVLSVNLSGPLYAARAVLPQMVAQGSGAIVNISGSAALMGGGGRGAHMATTKSGLHGLTRAIAAEFGPHGIRANTIVPSRIETETPDSVDPERLQRELNAITLRRLGTMQEVADLCAYLVSPAASYVTGQTIHLNGGLYMT